MPLVLGLTDDEALAIAESILAERLGFYGFDHADVRSGPDHDDDDSLHVVAVLKPRSPTIPPETYASARAALDEALIRGGERRFAYFRVDRPDEPVGVDENDE